MDDAELVRIWEAISAKLLKAHQSKLLSNHLKQVQPVGFSENIFVLTTPHQESKSYLSRHHYDEICDTLSTLLGNDISLVITISVPKEPENIPIRVIPTVENHHEAKGYQNVETFGNTNVSISPEQSHKRPSSNLREQYTFDNFVMCGANNVAYAASQAVAEQPASTYNPLFIYGPSGVGKTHLLHAIGNKLTQDFDSRILYVSTQKFTTDFIQSIRSPGQNNINKFYETYRNVDVLLIDDIQEVQEKEKTQEEFFQTFNYLHSIGKQIVISSDQHPKNIKNLTDRLRTRFVTGLVCDVGVPDYETRVAILLNRCEENNYIVPNEVIELISRRVYTDVRSLEGALIKVVAFSSINNVPVTTSTAKDILDEEYPEVSKVKVSPDIVVTEAAKYFNIDYDEIIGPSRTKEVAKARHISMYVIRNVTELSLPKIGKFFNNRDHSTVKHGCDRISELIKSDFEVSEDVKQLFEMINKASMN